MPRRWRGPYTPYGREEPSNTVANAPQLLSQAPSTGLKGVGRLPTLEDRRHEKSVASRKHPFNVATSRDAPFGSFRREGLIRRPISPLTRS